MIMSIIYKSCIFILYPFVFRYIIISSRYFTVCYFHHTQYISVRFDLGFFFSAAVLSFHNLVAAVDRM